MGKKRKSIDVGDAEKVEEEIQQERPKRTLLGLKDKPQQNDDDGEAASSSSFLFRNKEKVLVTCSQRINFSLQCRKHEDLYLWMAKCPDGPSVKFLVKSVHCGGTEAYWESSERFPSCFSIFDKLQHWRLLKELIIQIAVPHNESDKLPRGGLEKMTLIEVGPRFCLSPMKIFGGSFGAPTRYENPFYVSPNQIRLM